MCLRLVRKRECCGEKVQMCPLLPCNVQLPPYCIVEREYDRPWRHRCQRCVQRIAEMPEEHKGTRINHTSLENAANAIGEIRGRRPLEDPYFETPLSQLSDLGDLPGVPLNPSPTKRSEAGSIPSFPGTPATAEREKGLIYDMDGRPLPEEYQLGSLKTREEAEKHYKAQLQARKPECTPSDLERQWGFVAWQYEWTESLLDRASYRDPPETEGNRSYLEISWTT